MAENAIGHRNYAIIDESNLTAEEIEAVKKAKSFDGFFGVVPYEYGFVDLPLF